MTLNVLSETKRYLSYRGIYYALSNISVNVTKNSVLRWIRDRD